MTDTTSLSALALIDMERTIVENAEILAAEVVKRLSTGAAVSVSLVGLRGITTSYFNLVLRRIVKSIGFESLSERVTFEFDSSLQRLIYERSLQAIGRAA